MRLTLLVLSVLLIACATRTPLDVFVIGVAPLEGAALEQRIRVDLRILNPNDQALAAHGMRIQLDVNGQRLARGVSDAAFNVPRLGEATTSIIASTSLFDLARQVVVLSGRETMEYTLSGELFVDGIGRSVKFHQAGRFGVVNPTPPRALKKAAARLTGRSTWTLSFAACSYPRSFCWLAAPTATGRQGASSST